MRTFLVFFGLCLGGALLPTPVLYAQSQTEILAQAQAQAPEQTEAPPQPPGIGPVFATDVGVQPDDTHLDLIDLWRKIRHKDHPAQPPLAVGAGDRRFLVFAPSFGSRPNTGLTLGLNGNVAFFRGEHESTHLSLLSGGIRVSQKQQVLSNLRYAVFGHDDRWYFDGDNRANWTSINAYGLGASANTTGTSNLKYDFLRIYEAAYRRVKPGVFVGGGLNVNSRYDIRAGGTEASFDSSAYTSYTQEHGFALDRQESAGGNVAVRYDTRDNAINAERGWLAASTYRTFFNGFLGGDATWQDLTLDVRTYKKLNESGSQRIAFWMLTDIVTGGAAPFLDLPTTGGDVRSGRGYTEGRNRGERLAYGEIEYRGTLTPNGIAGFVAFLNTTTVGSDETGAHLFENAAPAGGFGLRFLLNKRSRTNLCTDWAWGQDGSRGFYLGLQEAF
jgi:hypothetical protein